MTMTRDFVRTLDFNREDSEAIFDRAIKIKADVKQRKFSNVLSGYNAALIFQKPSLRTRVTFDIGLKQLGGHAIYLGPNEISMGVRESVYDIGRNLERWVDLIVARVFSQAHVEELAAVAAPPVINALSDDEHPCQVYADYMALKEKGLAWNDIRLAYIGDGNNVCHSLLLLGGLLGANVRVGCPEAYWPEKSVVEKARELAKHHGGSIEVFVDPKEAVKGSNAVYTDIWASMGQENEAVERAKIFRPYQVNTDLLSHAEAGAYVMHDLPAHRGEEITDDAMDSPTSIVFDQAENRLHAQKSIVLSCLGVEYK